MKPDAFVIDQAAAAIVTAPLATPFRIASGQHDELANVFFRLRTTDGARGYGEAAVATHITGETLQGTLANLQAVGAALKGRTIDDPEAVCREVATRLSGNHAALAAVEMALLDISSRRQEIPLYRLFAPATPQGVKLGFATDITVVIGSLEEARVTAADFTARGFSSFKIKIGKDEDLDLRRVLAVREAAPESTLILDANMAFSADRMLAFLDRLDHNGVRPVLLEQPVKKNDWDGLAAITAALAGTGVLVCADESVSSLEDARRAIDSNAVTAINVKTMKSGLLMGAEIARLAVANGVRTMLGAMMESALSITASAHLAAGLGCFEVIDLDTTFFLKGDLARSPYLDASGRFDLGSAGPGIGLGVSGL